MPSFAEILYELPTERLRALVQTRSIEAKRLLAVGGSKRQFVQALSQELSRPNSVASAVLRCNARELRLLQLMVSCEANGQVSWTRLLETVGGSDLREALQPLLDRMETQGLVFSTPRGLFLAPVIMQQVPVSLPDRLTLAERLNTYDLAALKLIRDRLALEPTADTKPALVTAIRSHLLGNTPGLKLKNPLTEEEIEVLDYVVQAGGAAQAMEVVSALHMGRLDDFFRYDWTNRWRQGRERNAIDTLLARGLLYVISQQYGFNLFLVIPGDLMRVLTGEDDRAYWQEPAPAPTPLAEPPAQTARHTALCRDVVRLLGFLAGQEATRTNTGHIHRTALKNAARLLSLPDERYAMFLYALCRDAGLIAPQGTKQVYVLTPQGNQWLHQDSLSQTQALYEAWRGGVVYAEMENDPLIKASDYRPKDTVLTVRQATLGVVAEAAQDAYYQVDSLTDTLIFRSPLLLTQSVRFGLDLVASPATFMRLLVGECLFWLGLVEITKEQGTGDRGQGTEGKREKAKAGSASSTTAVEVKEFAFRLTPLGRFLLGLIGAETPELEPREDRFVVQANAEIFLPPFLEPATLYHLLALTEAPGKNATGSVVCLTRESIRRSLDRGESAREMLAFLQGHSRTGIPQNVEYLINEVGGKHGHIHIGRAQMYLQVDSALLLKELQARRELKPFFLRTLSDTVALLNAEEPDKLLRELRKAGYLPVSDDDTPPTAFRQESRAAAPNIRPAPMPQDKQSKRVAKTDAAIDWARIAQEDGQSWAAVRAPGKADLPQGAVTQPSLIPFIVKQAQRGYLCVEIAHQEPDASSPTVHLVEPQKVTSSVLVGYSRTVESTLTFPLHQIQWIRMTQDKFR